MSKFIKTVTVTGADDSVDISKLFEIQKQYPFVEFGILLSEKYSLKDGTSRFPSHSWLKELIRQNNESETKLCLSGHICGRWVTKALKGNFPTLNDLIDQSFSLSFNRYQLNTHAEFHEVNFDELCKILKGLKDCLNQSIIFQLDGVNDIIGKCRELGHTNISGLFDLSHGAGTLPSTWPQQLDGLYCGYAGGLSPSNVVEQIEKILSVNDKVTWIDAETHLRSEDNRSFDLNKVVEFLEKSKPYVI